MYAAPNEESVEMTTPRISVPHEELADFRQRHGLKSLAFFGSVLRDDFTDESDVDVLVEFEPGRTVGYIGFGQIEEELSELLGRKVDLNTPAMLSPYFREEVLGGASSATRPDPRVPLLHMLANAREAVAMARVENRESLDENRSLELALTHLVEIVGEAAAAVPREVQETLPTVPWSEAIRMRDRLVPGDDQVDLDFLWRAVRDDLPLLIAELERTIERLRPS